MKIPSRKIQQRIRLDFEKNKDIQDLNLINILIFKGTAELIETHNVWKQKNHMYNYFERDSDPTLLRLQDESLQKTKGNYFLLKFFQEKG